METLIAIGDFCTSTRGLCTGLSSTGPSNKLISNSWHAISLGLCGWLWLQLKFSIGGELVVGLGIGDGGVVGSTSDVQFLMVQTVILGDWSISCPNPFGVIVVWTAF